ncbi:MAG: hypothetical protein QGG40_19125 [Myxococcota bacterium]|jgi:hypothetical protein|nr:hypothetical protein [Myxococcota bacterium]
MRTYIFSSSLLSLALLSNTALADDLVKEAASQYEVPTITASQLSVQGEDLFSLAGASGDTSFNGHLGSTYQSIKQDPTGTLTMSNQLDTRVTTESTHALTTAGSDVFQTDCQQYLGDNPRGLFAGGGAALGLAKVGDQDAGGDVGFNIGGGYGRVVDARTVAQASAIYDVLERDATAEDLLRVAEVLGKYSSYAVQYKFEADLYFYQDLADAIGGADAKEIFTIRQVLESPLYNISSRKVGWTAGAQVDGAYGDLLNEGTMGAAMTQFFSWATLLDGSTGVSVDQTLSMGLVDGGSQSLTGPLSTPGEGVTEIDIDVSYEKEHGISWQSTVSIGWSTILAEAGSTNAWRLEAESNRAIGSDLVMGVAAAAGQTLDTEDLAWALTGNFTYYVF